MRHKFTLEHYYFINELLLEYTAKCTDFKGNIDLSFILHTQDYHFSEFLDCMHKTDISKIFLSSQSQNMKY